MKSAVFGVAPFSESRVRSEMLKRAAIRLHESFGFAVWVRVQGEAETSDWPSGTSTEDSASTTAAKTWRRGRDLNPRSG